MSHSRGRLTIDSGPLRVEAAFGKQRVCSGTWCWDHPLPHGSNINALWGRSANDLWAVGNQGLLQRWNGSAWVRWPALSGDNLQAISGVVTDDADGAPAVRIWAVGDSGVILRFDGQRWSREPAPDQTYLSAVWAADSDEVWALGAKGLALRRQNGVWRVATEISFPTPVALQAVGGLGRDRWFVGGVAEQDNLLRPYFFAWDQKTLTSVRYPNDTAKFRIRGTNTGAWLSEQGDAWVIGSYQLTPLDSPQPLPFRRDGVWGVPADPSAPSSVRYTTEQLSALYGISGDNVINDNYSCR